MYTIGQVSELFQLPVSTLRYYDKEGLFPEIKRSGGIRHFDTKELEAILERIQQAQDMELDFLKGVMERAEKMLEDVNNIIEGCTNRRRLS